MSVLVLLTIAAFASAQLPSGFYRDTMVSNANTPIRLRFLPDGRAMYVERVVGDFFVANPSTVPMTKSKLFTVSNVRGDGELGVLSFDLDPNFSSNGKLAILLHLPNLQGYFYVYYSSSSSSAFRISRFSFNSANIAGSELVLWTDPDGFSFSSHPYHFGGDLSFGPGKKPEHFSFALHALF